MSGGGDAGADAVPTDVGSATTVTIRCREHGPLVVELPDGVALRVTDHLGGEFDLPTHKRAVALCRCGASRSRPFCDGSHRDVGFLAPERAGPTSSG